MENVKKLIEGWDNADEKLLKLIRSNDVVTIYKPTGYNWRISLKNNKSPIYIPIISTYIGYRMSSSGKLSYLESGVFYYLGIYSDTTTSNSGFYGSGTLRPSSITAEGERKTLVFRDYTSVSNPQYEYFFQIPRVVFEKYVAEYGLKFELEKLEETV